MSTLRYAKITKKEKDPAVKIIQILLDNNADPNKEDIYGLIALHHAAMRDNGEIAKLLVSGGGNIDGLDKQQSTPLHIAATYGNTNVLEILLQAGANLRLQDEKDQNALHKAASSGNLRTIKIILDCADEKILDKIMKQRDRDGNNPLMLAVASGCFECLQILVSRFGSAEYMAVSNNHGEYPIHMGVRSGSKDIIELLSSHGAYLNQTNVLAQTPVYLAAECPLDNESGTGQNLGVIKFLINK